MKKLLLLTAALAASGLAHAEVTPIDSTNNVGFIAVTIATNLTIIAVPFEKCLPGGSGTPGMLSDLVSTNGLIGTDAIGNAALADQLVVLTTNADGPIYYYYWLKNGTGWSTNNTTVLGGTTTNVTSLDATNFPISRGLGFWIKRPTSVTTTTNLYLQGQIPTISSQLTIKPGLTMISMADLSGKSLNDPAIGWGTRSPGNGFTGMDRLIVVSNDGSGAMNYYYYHEGGSFGTLGKWCTHSPGPTEAVNIIGSGYGFWYCTTNSTTFTPVVP